MRVFGLAHLAHLFKNNILKIKIVLFKKQENKITTILLPKMNLKHLELLRSGLGAPRSSILEAPGLHDVLWM